MIDYLRELNFVSVALRLLLSAVIGFSLGMERGRKRRPAGCRTYMLVCMGATLTLLLSQYEYYMLTNRWYDLALEIGIRTDVSRFGAQVINGVGFYECVVLGTVLIFLSMRFLPTIENMMVERAPFLNIYVEFESLDNIGAIIGRIKEQNSQILDVEIDHGRGEGSGNPSAAFSLRLPRHQPHSDVLVSVSGLDCVYTVEEF